MSIEMVAALRVPFDAVPVAARARALMDGVLVYVGRVGASEHQLGLALRAIVGDALADHDDPRGVLVFPVTDAMLRAPTYDGVCAERGEVGLWLRPPSASAAGELAVTPGEVDLEIAALEARARKILAGDVDE